MMLPSTSGLTGQSGAEEFIPGCGQAIAIRQQMTGTPDTSNLNINGLSSATRCETAKQPRRPMDRHGAQPER
jgi:hypothetical protein